MDLIGLKLISFDFVSKMNLVELGYFYFDENTKKMFSFSGDEIEWYFIKWVEGTNNNFFYHKQTTTTNIDLIKKVKWNLGWSNKEEKHILKSCILTMETRNAKRKNFNLQKFKRTLDHLYSAFPSGDGGL